MASLVAEVKSRLRLAGAESDRDLDLGSTALDLAAMTSPGTDPTPYREHLATLGATLRERAEALEDTLDLLPARLEALQGVIVRQYGYVGDDESYDDLDNANLFRVIDRKRGLPVALSIICIAAARDAGWDAWGLNFPGHFLIRLDGDQGQRLIVDPYNGCKEMQAHDLRDLLKAMAGVGAELLPEYYEELPDRDVLLRLQNNIKVRLLQGQQIEAALDCLEIMSLIAPEAPFLWREIGLLSARLERLDEAVEALEVYMAMSDNDTSRQQTARLLQELRLKKSST